MNKITYSKDAIDLVGEELVRRRDINIRDDAPLTDDEIRCMLSGVYAMLCATADNVADTYRWLEQYEHELL